MLKLEQVEKRQTTTDYLFSSQVSILRHGELMLQLRGCLSDLERMCLACEQHQLPSNNKTLVIVLILAAYVPNK